MPMLQARLTPEEYLALERASPERSEYFAGEMSAMTGSSRRHNLIVTNLVGQLGRQLKPRPCELYANGMRVKISPTGLYTYPDIVVVSSVPVLED
jgi:Uma2 family endonuclease